MAKGPPPKLRNARDYKNLRDSVRKRYRRAPYELKSHAITVLQKLYCKPGNPYLDDNKRIVTSINVNEIAAEDVEVLEILLDAWTLSQEILAPNMGEHIRSGFSGFPTPGPSCKTKSVATLSKTIQSTVPETRAQTLPETAENPDNELFQAIASQYKDSKALYERASKHQAMKDELENTQAELRLANAQISELLQQKSSAPSSQSICQLEERAQKAEALQAALSSETYNAKLALSNAEKCLTEIQDALRITREKLTAWEDFARDRLGSTK